MTVAITAKGMVASLGLDAHTCCAAARAGLMRSEELPYAFNDIWNKKVEYAIGHRVTLVTEGFEGPARLARLMECGLRDLESRTGRLDQIRPAFYLSLPSRFRTVCGNELVADEEIRRQMTQTAGQASSERPYEDAARILQQAARALTWGVVPSLRYATISGHTGVAEAVSAALADFSSDSVNNAVVGGVDSLLDEETLDWLQQTGRLKTSAVPSGLLPGEAAAFVLLQRTDLSRTPPQALIRSTHVLRENGAFLQGDPPSGVALSEVIRETVKNLTDSERVWIITDQNGEPYRAQDWGLAVPRVLASPRDSILWYPAVSFGDTSAASGAVAICLAVRSFERHYAPSNSLLILSSADGTTRAAMCLESGRTVQ